MLFDLGLLISMLLAVLLGALLGLVRLLVTVFASWLTFRTAGPVGALVGETLSPELFAGDGLPGIALRMVTGFVIFSVVTVVGYWIAKRLTRQGALKWINRGAGSLSFAMLTAFAWAVVIWGLQLVPETTLAKLGRIDSDLKVSVYAEWVRSKNPMFRAEQSELLSTLLGLLGDQETSVEDVRKQKESLDVLQMIDEIYKQGSGEELDRAQLKKKVEELQAIMNDVKTFPDDRGE